MANDPAQGVCEAARVDASLPWEQLVTEGHVRAARVRWMRPWLLTFAVLAVLLGSYLQLKVRSKTAESNGGAMVMADVNQTQQPAEAAVARLPPLNTAGMTAEQLVPAAQLPALIAVMTDDLNKTGQVDKHHIDVKDVTADAFWKQNWSPAQVLSTSGTGVILAGGIFNAAPPSTAYIRYSPSPMRWIGVFRKKGSDWQYATLLGPNLLSVPNEPNVAAELIPLTLKPVLPEAK